MRRNVKLAMAGLLSVPTLYAVAGLVGGVIPVNGGWRAPADGIRIYVADNGIHTGIVLPVRAAGVDLGDLARPTDLRDPRYGGHGWRSFGWGDRDFYVGTPSWWDMNPLTILKAAFGSGASVMHVDFLPEPTPDRDIRSIMLRPAEYRRLVGYIRASYAPGAALPGYGADDVFYPAAGGYSATRTCNAWTGEALRHAGVRMGAWTPFPSMVMRWLPAN